MALPSSLNYTRHADATWKLSQRLFPLLSRTSPLLANAHSSAKTQLNTPSPKSLPGDHPRLWIILPTLNPTLSTPAVISPWTGIPRRAGCCLMALQWAPHFIGVQKPFAAKQMLKYSTPKSNLTNTFYMEAFKKKRKKMAETVLQAKPDPST